MARITLVATLTDNRLPLIRRLLKEGYGQLVRKTAFDVQGTAQELVHVDTGACRNGIYTVTDRGSGYAKGVQAAEARYAEKHKDGFPALPEVADVDEGEAVVACAAAYGAALEYGGEGHPAYPFIGPAAEAHRAAWEAGCRQVLG